MSEAQLYSLNLQLRLLARRNCVVGANGRLLQGAIDRPIERLREQVLSLLELVQDHRPLPQDHGETLKLAHLYIDRNRSVIRDLRREYA